MGSFFPLTFPLNAIWHKTVTKRAQGANDSFHKKLSPLACSFCAILRGQMKKLCDAICLFYLLCLGEIKIETGEGQKKAALSFSSRDGLQKKKKVYKDFSGQVIVSIIIV